MIRSKKASVFLIFFKKIFRVLFTVENLLEFIETPLDFKQFAVKSAAARTKTHATETFFHSTPLPSLLKSLPCGDKLVNRIAKL